MKQEPIDRDISFFPMFEQALHGDFEACEEQYQNLIQAKDKPYLLDDETVQRLIKVHEEKKEYISFYGPQFKRWREQPISNQQSQRLKKLEDKLPKLKELNEKVLELAYHISEFTIDKIVDMDPLQLALFEMGGVFDKPSPKIPQIKFRFLVFTDKRCEEEGKQYSFFFKDKGSDQEILEILHEFFVIEKKKFGELKGFGARRFMVFFINYVRENRLDHIMGILDFNHEDIVQEALQMYTTSFLKLWTDKYDENGDPLVEIVNIADLLA